MILLITRAVKSKWVWVDACVLAMALFVWVIFFAPVRVALQNRQWQLETTQTVGEIVLWAPKKICTNLHHEIKSLTKIRLLPPQVGISFIYYPHI